MSDAGKTSLTERLLYAAGVIDEIGSVDDGSTQTDSLALERQRGITIKSAVVSFVIDDVTVNLIDTPGHPDFIAEVERVLSVLDGAVLVISAVEGVQAQTRVLMRTLQRLRIPTLIFVNKIDRGARTMSACCGSIAEKLTPAIIPMGSVGGLGTRGASSQAVRRGDAGFHRQAGRAAGRPRRRVSGRVCPGRDAVSYGELRAQLAAQTQRALVHPVFFGSAITGAGVDALIAGITELLPALDGRRRWAGLGHGVQDRAGPAGEKIAYVRMFSGTVRTRDRLRSAGDGQRRGRPRRRAEGDRDQRVRSWRGRRSAIGGRGADRQALGARATSRSATRSASRATPSAAALLRPADAGNGGRPRRPGDKGALHVALAQLAEQDPLINLRQDDVRAGAVRLAVRRGAEGGDPGDAGERVQHRGRVPRDDDDLHRAAASARVRLWR